MESRLGYQRLGMEGIVGSAVRLAPNKLFFLSLLEIGRAIIVVLMSNLIKKVSSTYI